MPGQNRPARDSDTTTLARNGLAREGSVSLEQIRESVSLLARALGDTWKFSGTEAAAGMLLVTLARNNDLGQFLNGDGWQLVIRFITANPEVARHISPRTMGEIFSHLAAARAPTTAAC